MDLRRFGQAIDPLDTLPLCEDRTMTATPAPNNKRQSIDAEALLNWLDQQEELEYIRKSAGRTICEYRPNETTSSQRITTSGELSLPQQDGPLKKVVEQVWVPAQNMRGKAYATHELDKTINSVAKLMCIGTLWDFFTTIPIFQFSLSGPLTVFSGPAATILSFILLISSNYAGENSTNKSRGNGWMASVSLSAFLILCVTKTLFSGVGIDLWVGSKAIAGKYAEELAATKLKEDREQLAMLEAGDNDYKAARKACDEIKQQMADIDRNTNEKSYTSLYVQAYGFIADQDADKGLTNNELIKKYGSASKIRGACRRGDILLEISKEAAKPLRTSIDRKALLVNQMPALAYLEKHESDLYREHFKVVNGELIWINGTEAVGQATKQFYDSLFRGEFGLLGFSLFSLAISVILTLASAIMLYVISLNMKMKASFTGDLDVERDRMLNQYDKAVTRYLGEASPIQTSAAESTAGRSTDDDSSEHTDFQAKSLTWLINSARAPEDRVYAKGLYQERVFDLWRKHVRATGQTYYPPLADDLLEHYKINESNNPE